MSTIQTEYPSVMPKGLPGMPQGSDWDADTGIVETEEGIGFGLAVSQGAGERGVILGGDLAGFRGITQRDIAVTMHVGDKYPRYASAGVYKRGKIYVVAGSDGIVAGDPVHFDAATGALMKSGGVGPIPGARWAQAGDTGDITLVELYGTNVG